MFLKLSGGVGMVGKGCIVLLYAVLAIYPNCYFCSLSYSEIVVRCMFNLNLWRRLYFKLCFTFVFLQDDVSSPGDLVIADGGKSIKPQILAICLCVLNCFIPVILS